MLFRSNGGAFPFICDRSTLADEHLQNSCTHSSSSLSHRSRRKRRLHSGSRSRSTELAAGTLSSSTTTLTILRRRYVLSPVPFLHRSPALQSPVVRVRPYEHWHAKLGLYKTWDDFREEMLESGTDVEEVELAGLIEMESELLDPTFREKLDAATTCITENEKEADIILGVTHQVRFAPLKPARLC